MNNGMMNSRLLAGAATIAMLAVSSPALAQSTVPATDPATLGDTATDADASPEIVVTGTLLHRNKPETALPITVMSQESLERAGITNTADAVRQAAADGAGSIGVGFTSGFSAGGSAGLSASAGAFAGLRTGSNRRSLAKLDTSLLMPEIESLSVATDLGASFEVGGQANFEGSASLTADVGANTSLRSRIQFEE